MALIALPCQAKPLIPPLSLAYIATLLEQRRNIVRVYDLGLDPQLSVSTVFQPLRSFRPQVVIVAGEEDELLAEASAALRDDLRATVIPMRLSRSGLDAGSACASILEWLDSGTELPAAPRQELAIDQLPFPARHLISLESYELRAVGGELQTTMLIGGAVGGGRMLLRAPTQIVAELRSASQEFGVRHYLFSDTLITADRAWLTELLTRLSDNQLGVSWEATADAEQIDSPLLQQLALAGCEGLCFHLHAALVFESLHARARLRDVFAEARKLGIFVRAHVRLEPPYESVPSLVDVAATFGLDDVRFDVVNAEAVGNDADNSQLKAIARQIYDAGRDRQRIINRWGPALGNLIWRLRGPRGQASPNFDDDGITA